MFIIWRIEENVWFHLDFSLREDVFDTFHKIDYNILNKGADSQMKPDRRQNKVL